MSSAGPVGSWRRPGGPWPAGTVTAPPPVGPPPVGPPPGPPAAPPGAPDPPPPGPDRSRRQLLVFAGIAGLILAAGLVVALLVAIGGGGGRDRASRPTDVRPLLAQRCPAPTVVPQPGPSTAPAPPAAPDPGPGPRSVDSTAGISYREYPAPWEPWRTVWRAGTLEVPYTTGQHFVTETFSWGLYHASILSAAVPAADNDAMTLNLECVGRQVAADVRAEYYPQPNRMDLLRDEKVDMAGRPAWVTKFRLHFSQPGLTATSELAAVAVIDVGRPTAAVLYASVPATHPQYEWVVDDVLASVRPL